METLTPIASPFPLTVGPPLIPELIGELIKEGPNFGKQLATPLATPVHVLARLIKKQSHVADTYTS